MATGLEIPLQGVLMSGAQVQIVQAVLHMARASLASAGIALFSTHFQKVQTVGRKLMYSDWTAASQESVPSGHAPGRGDVAFVQDHELFSCNLLTDGRVV